MEITISRSQVREGLEMKGREGKESFWPCRKKKKVATEVGPGLTRELRIGC